MIARSSNDMTDTTSMAATHNRKKFVLWAHEITHISFFLEMNPSRFHHISSDVFDCFTVETLFC